MNPLVCIIMSSASDVVCATKRWEMDLRGLMYVSVSTSCTVATATAMMKVGTPLKTAFV